MNDLSFHFDQLPTQPSPKLLYFCKFAGIKKQTYIGTTFFENIVSKLFIAAQTLGVSSILDLYFLSQLSQYLRYNQMRIVFL
jgi:hypothetical protein